MKRIGPTAQDFKAALGLSDDDNTIGAVDADGITLAAIPALNEKLEEQRTENADLKNGSPAWKPPSVRLPRKTRAP